MFISNDTSSLNLCTCWTPHNPKVPCKRQTSINSGVWLQRVDDTTGVAKTDILRWAMKTNYKLVVKINLLQKVILHYGKKGLFWSLIFFGCLSFTTVWGQKIGFNSSECIKFLNITNVHAFHVWGKCIFKLQWYNIFLSLFFLLQRNFFPLRLRHQTYATKLRYLQSSTFYRAPIPTAILR